MSGAVAAPPSTAAGARTTPAPTPATFRPLADRYVDDAPFDPRTEDALTPEQERFYTASQWRLIWWRFRRHKVAVASAIVLLLFYASTLFTEFLAPYDLHRRDSKHIYAPPQASTSSTRAPSSARSSTATPRSSTCRT
jgi:hypothetical protein